MKNFTYHAYTKNLPKASFVAPILKKVTFPIGMIYTVVVSEDNTVNTPHPSFFRIEFSENIL